jgi:thiol-disulfide isomerase/thioredoxin
MARRVTLSIGVVVAVSISVLGCGGKQHDSSKVNRRPAKQDSPPAQQADGTADLMGVDLRGSSAPGFTLKDLHGKNVSLADYKGRVVLVNFWATYCGPCKLEMPWLEQLQR